MPINTGLRDDPDIVTTVSPVLVVVVDVVNPPAVPVGALPLVGNGDNRWVVPVSELVETIVRDAVSIVTV